MVVVVGYIMCCTAGLAVCLNWLNCIKKAWNSSVYHWVENCYFGFVLISYKFSQNTERLVFSGQISPEWRLLPVWLDLGSGFKSCLGGTVRQEMKTCSRTICSKKCHFNYQAGQKEQSSAPANIEHSRSWMWHPVWHTALTEGNPQATLLLWSFSHAGSHTGAHIIQRFCE